MKRAYSFSVLVLFGTVLIACASAQHAPLEPLSTVDLSRWQNCQHRISSGDENFQQYQALPSSPARADWLVSHGCPADVARNEQAQNTPSAPPTPDTENPPVEGADLTQWLNCRAHVQNTSLTRAAYAILSTTEERLQWLLERGCPRNIAAPSPPPAPPANPGSGTIRVRGYTRPDGTQVQGYTRHVNQ